MKVSKTGYKSNSKDKNEKALVIPTNSITMKNVPHPVLGIDNVGNVKMMYPGQDYVYPGANFVTEIPMKKNGGSYGKKPNNDGFMALPEHVQEYILAHMQEGGGFDTAKKVTTVPSDYNFSGSQNNKKYFAKNIQAPAAIKGNGAKADAGLHQQFLIKQLQSGVKPEAIVSAGHATSEGIKSLSSYYKPAMVYTEANPPAAAPPVNKTAGIPMNESDRVEMKQIWPNNGGKYLTFQVPDANAGYSKPTEQYYDPSTYRPIDPLKSFSTGVYKPEFLYSDPSQGILSEKYRGTKVATRVDSDKIGQKDMVNLNPAITGSVGANFKMGGSPLNKYFKNRVPGLTSPQGESLDDYIKGMNLDFVDHLANNNRNAMLKEAVMGIQENGNFFQDGGGINFDPSGAAAFDPDQFWLNNPNGLPSAPDATGPIPHFADPSKKALKSSDLAMPAGNISPTQGDPNYTGARAAFDNNDVPQYVKDHLANAGESKMSGMAESGGKNYGAMLATGIETGLGFLHEGFQRQEELRKEKWLDKQMRIENQVPKNYGDKGNYDVNQGNFRPNQKTMVSYRDGGGVAVLPKAQWGAAVQIGLPILLNYLNKKNGQPGQQGQQNNGGGGLSSLIQGFSQMGGMEALGAMKKGGEKSYKHGGTYEASHDEIKDLIAKGYKIEFTS